LDIHVYFRSPIARAEGCIGGAAATAVIRATSIVPPGFVSALPRDYRCGSSHPGIRNSAGQPTRARATTKHHLCMTARAAYHNQLVPPPRCCGRWPDGDAAWPLWFGTGRGSRGRGENGNERGESALGERQHSMSAMASPPPASFAAASSITDLTQRILLSWLVVGTPAYDAT